MMTYFTSLSEVSNLDCPMRLISLGMDTVWCVSEGGLSVSNVEINIHILLEPHQPKAHKACAGACS